jgi:hypothetical protein
VSERSLLLGTTRRLPCILGICLSIGLVAHADTPPPPPSPAVSAPPLPAPAPAPAQPQPVPWEKIDDDDGIAVYRREVPGSPIIAFKGEGVIDASILRVTSVIVDTTRATEWVESLVEARTLRHVSETEYIEYDHVGTPFVMKDRDFVLDIKLELEPASKKAILKFHSVTDPLAPTTSYVRGELMQSSFALTALEHGTKTHIVAEIHCDPKGSVAKWIVNWFQKSWPHSTITRLRAQAAKPDIVDHPRLKQVLTDKGYFN